MRSSSLLSLDLSISQAGILPTSSKSRQDGLETFHPLSPEHMLRIPEEYSWFKRLAVSYEEEERCCSRESVSFHYISSPKKMKCLDQLIYRNGD
jgi:hypothetical protein